MTLLKRCREGLLHLFFPRLCEGCRTPLLLEEQVLCLTCFSALPLTGYHSVPDNPAALRFAGRFPFEKASSYALFVQDGLLQHLLHRLKYKGRKEIGGALGRWMGEELKASGWSLQGMVVAPVPLHPRKEAGRGFNQSALIAEGMGEAMGLPVAVGLLRRRRSTESQTRKSREERLQNVQEAFGLGRQKPEARHVLLVDDVLTTGATLEACALVLLKAGYRVSIAAIGLADEG